MRFISDETRRQCYTDISRALPPPVLDIERDDRSRIGTAVEAFNDLQPGTAYEAQLAVTIVLCGAHAMDCLRDAGVYRDDFAKMTRCRAQAASMMREARAAKRILVQEQKQWALLELATDAARIRLGPSAPPSQAAPAPVQAAPPASAAAPTPAAAPAPAPRHQPAPRLHLVATAAAPPSAPAAAPSAQAEVAPPSPEAIARAEAFVSANILAAAQIRAERGITPDCRKAFGRTLPTDPAMLDALVRGSSDMLDALDGLHEELRDAAD